MENDVIVCRTNMFSNVQKIIFPDGTEEASTMDNLAKFLSVSCREKEIYNIHLFGQSNYLIKLINEIQAEEITNYGINKIFIEVN